MSSISRLFSSAKALGQSFQVLRNVRGPNTSSRLLSSKPPKGEPPVNSTQNPTTAPNRAPVNPHAFLSPSKVNVAQTTESASSSSGSKPPPSWFGLFSKYLFAGGFFAGVAYVGYEIYNDPKVVTDTIDRMQSYTATVQRPIDDRLLPDPLPEHQQPYTLVIDLEGFLVHSVWDWKHGWRTMKRPYVEEFLDELSNYYEIVCFTRESMHTASSKLERLDSKGRIAYRLFRESTFFEDNVHFKDLSFLHRDMSKVICFDPDPHKHNKQPENTVFLTPWEGNPKDTYLKDIIPFLTALAYTSTDIREVIKAYGDKDIPAAYAEEVQKRREAARKQRANSKSLAGRSFMKGKGSE